MQTTPGQYSSSVSFAISFRLQGHRFGDFDGTRNLHNLRWVRLCRISLTIIQQGTIVLFYQCNEYFTLAVYQMKSTKVTVCDAYTLACNYNVRGKSHRGSKTFMIRSSTSRRYYFRFLFTRRFVLHKLMVHLLDRINLTNIVSKISTELRLHVSGRSILGGFLW